MNRITSALVVLFVCLVPISVSPLPLNSKWCDVVLVALAIALGSRLWRGWRPTVLDWCILSYLAASALAIRPEYGLTFGMSALTKQFAVVLVYIVFAAVARASGVALTVRALVLTAVGLSVAGLGAAVLFLVTGWVVPWLGSPMPLPYVRNVFRLYGLTDSPEMFACFLTFAVALATAPIVAATPRSRLATVFTIAVASLATFAHSIAGGILATSVAAGADQRARPWPLWRRSLLATGLAATLAANLALIVTVREVTFTGGHRTDIAAPQGVYGFQDTQGASTADVHLTYNWMSYFLLKRVAWDAFISAPWRGTGLGRFHELTERAYQAGQIHSPYRRIDPHSTLMGRLAETGAIGGITLVALWAAAFLTVRQLAGVAASRAVAVGLFGAFVGLAVNAINVDVMNFRFLWIGFGLLRGIAGPHKQ